MKERVDGLTASEMENVESKRLSPEQAQDLANLIITKLNGFDPKKLEAEDYEEALKEIENIKAWANGERRTLYGLYTILKTTSAFGIAGILCGLLISAIDSNSIMAGSAPAFIGAASGFTTGNIINIMKDAYGAPGGIQDKKIKELSKLEQKTDERLKAEAKFKE